MSDTTNPAKPRPTCPLCGSQKFRRTDVKVWSGDASQKLPYVSLACTRCSHALLFAGASNLYDLT